MVTLIFFFLYDLQVSLFNSRALHARHCHVFCLFSFETVPPFVSTVSPSEVSIYSYFFHR